jgi:acetyl esterase/lipase
VKGHKSITIHPDEQKSDIHLVYFHGGAYISQGRIVHWILLSRIVSELGCRATYVDYPLAPEFTYKDTVEMAQKTYIRLTENYPDDNFILGGDSAGGGLTLVLAQVVRDMEYSIQPSKLVMICPWLDIAMDSRRIKRIEKKDFILNRKKLLEFAKQYAGHDGLKNPLVSPLFGSISGLGKMLLVSGTHELIYPDCHELYKKARNEDADLEYLVYNKMPHVWIFYPIMEAKHVFEKIMDFLRD